MAAAQTIRVKEMPRASVLEDGTYVEMEFKGEAGERITLGFTPVALDRFTARAHQLTFRARTQKSASTGHLEVQAEPVAATTAEAAIGGSAVIVGLRTEGAQVLHYSLQIEEAAQLQNKLVDAVASARKQTKQTRQ